MLSKSPTLNRQNATVADFAVAVVDAIVAVQSWQSPLFVAFIVATVVIAIVNVVVAQKTYLFNECVKPPLLNIYILFVLL